MLSAILVLATLAADPAPTPAPQAKQAEQPEADPPAPAPAAPEVEIIIPQQMLEDFLSAAAPIDRTLTRQVSMMGFSKTVKIDLTLTNPRVRVTPEGIKVTMDYNLRGPAGMTSRGVATPRLELRALEDKGELEGRLTGARLSATGGIEVPMEELMEPFVFPAGASGSLPVAGQAVDAKVKTREVVLEDGQVRVRGGWEFKKPEKAAR